MLFGAQLAQAEVKEYTLLEPLPCIPNAGQTCGTNNSVSKIDLKGYVGYMFKLIIAIAGAIAVFRITWAGFKYMTTEAVSGKGTAKTEIQNSIYGLLMLLGSYLILRTIDPRLVNITTELPPVTRADDIQWDQFFTEINQRSAMLMEAKTQAKRKKALEVDPESEEGIRLNTEALKLEQQAMRIRTSALLEQDVQGLRDIQANANSAHIGNFIAGNNYVVSEDTKKTFLGSINGMIKRGEGDIQKLKELGDVAGATAFENKLYGYSEKERNAFAFLDDFSTIQNKYRQGIPAKILAKGTIIGLLFSSNDKATKTFVSDGQNLLAKLEAQRRLAPERVKDPIIREEYLAQITNEIAQVHTAIDPLNK